MTHFAWFCVYWTLFIVYAVIGLVLLGAWLAGQVSFLRAVLWPLYALWAVVRTVAS